MIKIAHRGNTEGSDTENENSPIYVDKALEKGYDSEIDVWVNDDKIFLGHDGPKYPIEKDWLFLRSDKLWCHAKNVEALDYLLSWERINCFWHQSDHYTITSKKYIWAYPGYYGSSDRTIAVKPNDNIDLSKFIGICSNEIKKYEGF